MPFAPASDQPFSRGRSQMRDTWLHMQPEPEVGFKVVPEVVLISGTINIGWSCWAEGACSPTHCQHGYALSQPPAATHTGLWHSEATSECFHGANLKILCLLDRRLLRPDDMITFAVDGRPTRTDVGADRNSGDPASRHQDLPPPQLEPAASKYMRKEHRWKCEGIPPVVIWMCLTWPLPP